MKKKEYIIFEKTFQSLLDDLSGTENRIYDFKLSPEDIKILHTVYSFKLSPDDLFFACAEFVDKKSERENE